MVGTFISALGRPAIDAIAAAGATLLFLMRGLGVIARHGFPVRETVRLIGRLGVSCVGPVLLVVAPMGAVMALEGDVIVRWFGVDRLLAPLVALAMAREIAPGFSALMIAMQAGAAIAAELGAMRARDEIDAHEVMAVDPLRALVAPRLGAGLIVTPLLNLIALVFGVATAYLVAVYGRGMAGAAFIENALYWLQPSDVWGGELKAAIYGLIITAISCYQGYHASRSAVGVGEAANRAIVHAIVVLPIANYAINSALYAGVGR
jgi:phospholipid/cholesterol/gamma-HCH transport system permease protein